MEGGASQASSGIFANNNGGLAPAERKPTTGHKCAGVCCACRPIRVMRDNCIKNNPENGEACQSFVDAFKACVEAKKADIAANKARQEALLANGGEHACK